MNIDTLYYLQISATVSNDGVCNNDFVIHYEGTTDAAQREPPNPGMDHNPSATLESFTVVTVLLLQRNIFFFPSVFSLFPHKRRIFPDPLSFSPHDISKFRVRHKTRSGF